MESCTAPASFNTTFFLNCLIHMLILFTVLTVFFVVYISRLEVRSFQKEIGGLLGVQMDKAFASLSPEKKKVFLEGLQNVDLDKLQELYAKPANVLVINNKWLRTVAYTVIVCLMVITVLTIILLRVSCRLCVNLNELLLENAVIFIFVGMIEIGFFLFIASRYVPVAPSTMTSTMIDELKKKFTT